MSVFGLSWRAWLPVNGGQESRPKYEHRVRSLVGHFYLARFWRHAYLGSPRCRTTALGAVAARSGESTETNDSEFGRSETSRLSRCRRAGASGCGMRQAGNQLERGASAGHSRKGSEDGSHLRRLAVLSRRSRGRAWRLKKDRKST